MEKVYVDATEMAKKGYMGVMIDTHQEVVLAGPTVSAMDVALKEEYKKYQVHYDLQFIFEDSVPSIPFYTVPHVEIVAVDSVGGFIASVGQSFDIESGAPVYYISEKLECFRVARNGQEFLKNMSSWKNNLKLCDVLKMYPSKIEAEKEVSFIELPPIQIEEGID